MAPPFAGCQLRVIRDRAVETLRRLMSAVSPIADKVCSAAKGRDVPIATIALFARTSIAPKIMALTRN